MKRSAGLLAVVLSGCIHNGRPDAPATTNEAEEVVVALDSESPELKTTPGMAAALSGGPAAFGRGLREQLGAPRAIRTVWTSPPGEGLHRYELSVDHEGAPLPSRWEVALDANGALAGLAVQEAIGQLTDAELASRIAAMPGRWSAHAVAVDGSGQPQQLDFDGARPAPVASQYKVLLVAAACDALARGEVKQTDRIPLDGALRGLPSCTLCRFDEGLAPTWHDHLSLISSTSDNTASDALLMRLGRERVESVARAAGLTHVPPLITTQGLFALECGKGPLAALPKERWAAELAAMSPKQQLEAADGAARAAFADGPKAMNAACFRGQHPDSVRRDVAHVIDWNLRADELSALYLRAMQGQLLSREASSCFLNAMEEGGRAGLEEGSRLRRAGSKNGSEEDVRSLGLWVSSDRGPIAVSVSVHGLPDGAIDGAQRRTEQLSRALVWHLWRRLPAFVPPTAGVLPP